MTDWAAVRRAEEKLRQTREAFLTEREWYMHGAFWRKAFPWGMKSERIVEGNLLDCVNYQHNKDLGQSTLAEPENIVRLR